MAESLEESTQESVNTVTVTFADRLNNSNIADAGNVLITQNKTASIETKSAVKNVSCPEESLADNVTKQRTIEGTDAEHSDYVNCKTTKTEMRLKSKNRIENLESENSNPCIGNSETNGTVRDSDRGVLIVDTGSNKVEHATDEAMGAIKEDEHVDIEADSREKFVDSSESSSSDAEYESADEGEDLQVDKQNLKELEDTLTDEEKEERRDCALLLKGEGNELFRCGSYKSAIRIYSRALRTCPLKFPKDRAIMYSNRGACKMKLEYFAESIRDCSKAVDLHPYYMKALMRRAELYEKTDKLDEALADYQKIVQLDPSQHNARVACTKLPDRINERNDKLKEEMVGKLKDLGNMVLRPFGLSTNNFQMNQDPNTGGYSVNFVQNPQQQ